LTNKKKITTEKKSGLHPRNKNNARYDFVTLLGQYPELRQFVFVNRYQRETIDFSNPDAVRALNSVLLHHFYGVHFWDIPKDYLCPPVPGRADYIHHLADLLATVNNNVIPQGTAVSVLDIGAGANCIYPLLGYKEYGWKFIGTEIDSVAVSSARNILESNHIPPDHISIRLQSDPGIFFRGVLLPSEQYDITMCNPPFHSSLEQAVAGTKRKWKNLGINSSGNTVLNFGGQQNELYYPGGEAAFVKGLIADSADFSEQVFWFSTLLSKGSNLEFVKKHLHHFGAKEVRIIGMEQGQKKSRFVAWTFLTMEQQRAWKMSHWQSEPPLKT